MGVKYASHMMINKVMTEELHDIKMYWEFQYYRVNGMHGIVRIMSLFFFNHMTAGVLQQFGMAVVSPTF